MLGQLSVLTAGLWQVFWPAAIGTVIVVLLLALAYFSPLGKRYFVEAAVIVVIGVGVYQFGLHQADARCRAQNIAATKVINKVVHKAVRHTTTKRARAAIDPWNRRDY